MTSYLTAAAMAMLGPVPYRYADPAAGDQLHAAPGIRLPSDYQVSWTPTRPSRSTATCTCTTPRPNAGTWARRYGAR